MCSKATKNTAGSMGHIDTELLELIRSTINGGWVSVYFMPDGSGREYSVPLANDDETAMYLTCDYLGDANEYTIEIGGNVIASAVISMKGKVRTTPEQEILSLFSLCSNRIVAQELQRKFVTQTQKTYS